MTFTRLSSPLLVRLIQKVSLIAIAAFFSFFTLWFVQSSLKYVLFVFEISVILTIYFILKNREIRFLGSVFDATEKILVTPIPELLLISFSIVLIFLNILHLQSLQELQLLLSFLVVSILSGFSLSKLFNITIYFSRLEVIILSYIISFLFSGSCSLVFMSVDHNIRSVLILSLFVIIGSASLLRHRRLATPTYITVRRVSSLSRNTDIIAIALAIVFYIIFYYHTYPNFVSLSGSDISRHFSDSVVLSRTPDLYAQRTGYIMFHAFQAAFYTLSGSYQSAASFLSILILLNIFLPLAVYALSKRYLRKVDDRIPAISTIFYSILSNFSFIYFTQLKLIDTSSTELQILASEVADRAFNGTINFLQPFAWFVPLSVSFIMFIAALLLLLTKQVPKRLFIPLYTALILGMYFTHASEALTFAILISVYAFISRAPKGSIQLTEALISSLLAFSIAVAFTLYVYLYWQVKVSNPSIPLTPLTSLTLSIVFLIVGLIWRLEILPRFHFTMKFLKNRKFFTSISSLLIVIYLFGFVSWIFIDAFNTSAFYDVGVTPWFIYPLMLGVVGLFSILAIRYINTLTQYQGIVIISVSILTILVLGRLVSFININYLITGYWEKRFLSFLFLLCCLIAPIPLIKFSEQIQTLNKRKFMRNWSLMGIVSLIVLVGFSTTILQSIYWFGITNESTRILSKNESQALSFLKNVLERDQHAFVITPTDTSKMNLVFAAPGYIFSLPMVPFSAKYPDVPLIALSAHNLDHAYIYLHARDLNFLRLQPSGWLASHAFSLMPTVFSNGEVTILNATKVTYPSPKSDTTVLIPSESQNDAWMFAYDIVSESGKNYTVRFDTDSGALTSKNVVLSFDPNPNYFSFYDDFSSTYPNWLSISGSWQMEPPGLHAGDKTGRTENIILSPVSSRSFKASTNFSINHLDTKVANYASIVYSWADDKNYRYAGIGIFNNATYVHFATVTNGNTSYYPEWPGKKTDLEWKPGEHYNLTLSANSENNFEHLFINGTEYLQQLYYGKLGRLGLSYGRTNDLTFSNFMSIGKDESHIRKVSDYMSYVKNGGHLFILNTNGYGAISDYISHNIHDSIRTLKPQSELSQLNRLSPNAFVTVSNVDQGKITYLDIYSVLNQRSHNNVIAISGQLFRNLSTILPMNSLDTSPLTIKDFKGVFRQLNANGTIKVSTPSVIFPTPIELDEIRITSGNQILSIANVTTLDIMQHGNVVLRSDRLTLANGRGLYANLLFGGIQNAPPHVDLSFSNDTSEIFVTSPEGELLHFLNLSKIQIVNREPIPIYARQPYVTVDKGTALFHGLYPLELYARAQATNKDLRTSGNTSFSVIMSDSFTYIRYLGIDGSAVREGTSPSFNEPPPPNFTFSKLYSLPILVRILLLIPFLLAAIFILYSRSSEIKKSSKSEVRT